MTAYALLPMSAADLPTIRRWLGTPHIRQWWHNPLQQFEPVSGDLGHPDRAQCYNLGTWNTGFGPQPEGTRGLDQFIGEADMLDHGHGSTFIGLFADRLLACGTPRIVTDPDPVKLRAIGACKKAGFRHDRMVDTPDGPSLLMVRDP